MIRAPFASKLLFACLVDGMRQLSRRILTPELFPGKVRMPPSAWGLSRLSTPNPLVPPLYLTPFYPGTMGPDVMRRSLL